MCGLIRLLVNYNGCGGSSEFSGAMYSLERVADHCRREFLHALMGKPYY